MNIIAAAVPTQTPFAQSPPPAYQNTTAQPAKPQYKPSFAAKTITWGYLLCYVCIVIFFVVMTYRFIRAMEKIADKVEKGIIIRKEDSSNSSQA